MKHLLKGAAAAVVTLLALAAPASAGSILNAAGASLHNNPVYVAPGASPALTSSEADNLRKQIDAGKHPMFIAVLPEAVKGEVGTPDRLIPGLIDATRLSGVYGAVAGPVFRGGETSTGGVPNAAPLATQVYNNDHSKGLYPMLHDYVSQVESAPVLVGGAEKKPSKPFPWLWVILPIVLFLALVGGLLYWWRRRRQQSDLDDDRNDLLSKIYSLQSQINGLTTIGDTSNYNAALDLVQRAAQRAETANRYADLTAAQGLYREAQQSYTAAKRSTVAGTATKAVRDDIVESSTVHKTDLPAPTRKVPQSANTYRSGYDGPYSQTCYPGYNYGYYPGYGYGYIGFDGNFMAGVLEGELLADMAQPDVVVEQEPAYAGGVDSGGGGGYDSGSSYDGGGVDSGGGGGWDNGSSSSDSGSSSDYSSGYDSGGGGGGYDFGGGGGSDFGGGGGDSGGGGSW